MAPVRREDNHLEVAATWEDLVERKIREAQERGDFDNLSGQGQPLRIETNPYARDWELAYKILSDHGFAPPWVEASRIMEQAVDAVRAASKSWPGPRPSERAAQRAAHLERVRAANAAIDRFNLLTPFPWLQRARLSLEAEVRRFDAAWPGE